MSRFDNPRVIGICEIGRLLDLRKSIGELGASVGCYEFAGCISDGLLALRLRNDLAAQTERQSGDSSVIDQRDAGRAITRPKRTLDRFHDVLSTLSDGNHSW